MPGAGDGWSSGGKSKSNCTNNSSFLCPDHDLLGTCKSKKYKSIRTKVVQFELLKLAVQIFPDGRNSFNVDPKGYYFEV
jgi:hypothetical protein